MVKATIPADRLLVLEVAGGWRPLCDFPGVEAPQSEFPRVNDTGNVLELFNASVARGFQPGPGYKR